MGDQEHFVTEQHHESDGLRFKGVKKRHSIYRNYQFMMNEKRKDYIPKSEIEKEFGEKSYRMSEKLLKQRVAARYNRAMKLAILKKYLDDNNCKRKQRTPKEDEKNRKLEEERKRKQQQDDSLLPNIRN